MEIAIYIGIAVFVFTLLAIKLRGLVSRVDEKMSEESGLITKSVQKRKFSFHISPSETVEFIEDNLPERIDPEVLTVDVTEKFKSNVESSLLELLRNPDADAEDVRIAVRETKKTAIRVTQSDPEPVKSINTEKSPDTNTPTQTIDPTQTKDPIQTHAHATSGDTEESNQENPETDIDPEDYEDLISL